MSFRGIEHCLRCGKPLNASKLPYVGDDCAKRFTPAQLEAMAAYAAYAAQVADPFHVPAERPLSAQGRINNLNARLAAAAPDAGQLCRHENRVGACPACRREADPWRAAETILRDICSQTHADRRAERIAVQAARRAAGIPAPAKRPARRPSRRRPAAPTPPPEPPAPEPAAVQLELQ